MVFDPHPPYTILATDRIDFATMQRLVRFARYWDLVANSGRFAHTLPLILGDAPFAHFMALSDWLYAQPTRRTASRWNGWRRWSANGCRPRAWQRRPPARCWPATMPARSTGRRRERRADARPQRQARHRDAGRAPRQPAIVDID